ncbi:MAG: DUF3336 domain-containing protein, partial [Gammaproteobacteria bacterium]|nr:DUF3336 domain-containing protein [Gammaproteobacteria bacterium]
DDLPAKRLGRLYSTNHTIVSMVNPIALPFLQNGRPRSGLLAGVGKIWIELARGALNSYRTQVQHYSEWPRFNMLVNSVHSLLDQDYHGDINIVPGFSWYNPVKILSHLSEDELMALMREGERSTWPQMAAIENCTKISRALDNILERYERRDPRSIPAARRRPKRLAVGKKTVAKKGSRTKKPERKLAAVKAA